MFILLFALLAFSSLHAETEVLALAGSTREGSFNKLLVKEAAKMAEGMGAKVTYVDLKDYPIPFFDEDLEGQVGLPENAKKLRQLFIKSQIIMIASPTHNASVSAVLKNAIDWLSRDDEGDPQADALTGKKFVLLSASPGKKGGARGLIHLKDILDDVNGDIFPQQFSLPLADEAFDAQGHLKNGEQKKVLQQLIQEALFSKNG